MLSIYNNTFKNEYTVIKHNYYQILLIIFMLAFAIQAKAVSVVSASPTAQLRTTVDAILDILRDKTLGVETRRDKIRTLVNQRFYFRAMSQRTLGRNWKKASTEQQNKFVTLFSDLLGKTYLGRIEAYTDERVEYLREKNKNPKRAVVYTQIVTKSADIPINYKLAKKGDQWLIYDVIIEEVSLISNYRSSYAEIIKKDGIDSLLEKIKEKLKTADAS